MPKLPSLSSSGELFSKYNIRKCVGYAMLLVASVTVMGYIAELCSNDDAGGCASNRFSYLVAAGAISAGFCLALLFLNLTQLKYLLHIEVIALLLLFCLWAAMAAVASSVKTGLGADVGLAFSWIGFAFVSFLLFYILENKGLPFTITVEAGVKKGKKGEQNRESQPEHEEEEQPAAQEGDTPAVQV